MTAERAAEQLTKMSAKLSRELLDLLASLDRRGQGTEVRPRQVLEADRGVQRVRHGRPRSGCGRTPVLQGHGLDAGSSGCGGRQGPAGAGAGRVPGSRNPNLAPSCWPSEVRPWPGYSWTGGRDARQQGLDRRRAVVHGLPRVRAVAAEGSGTTGGGGPRVREADPPAARRELDADVRANWWPDKQGAWDEIFPSRRRHVSGGSTCGATGMATADENYHFIYPVAIVPGGAVTLAWCSSRSPSSGPCGRT